MTSFGLILGGGAVLSQVARELTTAVERELAPLGLTAQQAALLLHASRGAQSPRQLRRELGTDTAGMTRLVDRLAEKGLLVRQRHPEDRRAIVLELTPAGSALVPRLPPIFGGVSQRVFAGLSTAELAQVTGLLQRMLDNLRATPADGP